MVITGGENVHPTEVEEVLRRNADVADVAVVGVPDSVYGSSLVAHVVPVAGITPHEDILLAWSRDRHFFAARASSPRALAAFMHAFPY